MADGALKPYRILDLTTDRGWLAGRLLADLGADVIKIEPPSGDPGRELAPFAGGAPNPETGLVWWAYNRGKRSAILDLETSADRELFLALAAGADAVIESFEPGQMESWGLGLDALVAANPRIVLTRITPFGQTGPYAGFAASDLTLSAVGGAAWLVGEPDRAPVRVTAPQYFPHAASEAALHTVVGLFHAASTGEGQQIDVSAHATIIRTLSNAFMHAHTDGRLIRREKLGEPNEHTLFRSLFRCADGYAISLVRMGAGLVGFRNWAREEGDPIPEVFDAMSEEDMKTRLAEPGDLVDGMSAWLDGFFAKRTRATLVAEGLKRRLQISGANTLADILDDEQLEFRGFFQPAASPGRSAPIRFPGVWAHLSGTPIANRPAAPRIGEHDHEIRGEAARVRSRSAVAGQPAGESGARRSSRDVFAGLKVWDTSWVGVGPLTTRYLADYGATVVRSESMRSLDVLRRIGPFTGGVSGINRSHFFNEFNASKLGLGVNLATPEGREVGLRLAAWADVVVESYSPGVMERFGLDYEALRAVNPSIVMLSTSMNGQTGPRRNFSGFGTSLIAMAGLVDLTGWPDRPPYSPFGPYTDFVAQRFCGTALMAALDHRRRTGQGQYIDVSQYEASIQFLAPLLLDTAVNGRVLTRDGNRDLNAAPHGIFRCLDEGGLDRWVAIAVETEAQWSALVRRIGAPAWALDATFASFQGRKANEVALEAHISAWTANKTAAEVVGLLQPEVPAAPVLTNLELLEDPQLRHRGYLHSLHHPEVGEATYEGSQVIASATPAYPRKAAPVFGADNLQVLQDFLGYEPSEIEVLIAKGVVEG